MNKKSERPQVVLVNRAIILKNKKILLVQRSKNDSYSPLKWELPEGKLDKGQDISDALEREVLEETGLLIMPVNRVVYYNSKILTSYKYKGLPYISLIGIAKPISNTEKVKLSDEHEDYKWVTLNKALKMDLVQETKKAILVLEDKINDYS